MKKSLMQMGAGAAIASAVLVTVYEGKVILANEKGQTQLGAGEQARVARGQAPSAASDARAPYNAALANAPAEGITREDLLKRDQQQRAELEKLRSRVHQLEASSAGGAGSGSGKRESFLNTSKDEIQAMAKDCKLKWDQPTIGAKPETVGDEEVKELGLTEQERAEINRVNAEVNARVTAQLRQLYVEVTGDKAGAEILAPRALEQEIMEKSSEKDAKQAFYNLSHERAGLQPPPANADAVPPVERMMRLMTSLGDTYERDLGKAIGPDLAHRLRADHGGWGSRSTSSMGCPQ